MSITSLQEVKVLPLLVKHPLIYRDLKSDEGFFFSIRTKMVHHDSYKCITVINSKQPPPELHPTLSMHFSVTCETVIDHPLTFKGDTHQHNLTGNEQSLSFPPSYLFIIHAPNSFVWPFLFISSIALLAFAVCLGRKFMPLPFPSMSWNSAIINCLSTVITETSEGHMGCNRPLCLLDKEIKIHFCHRIAQYIMGGIRQPH